jgi:hypothetical protein
MKFIFVITVLSILSFSCNDTTKKANDHEMPIEGTWQLISGTTVEKGDTTVTDYTKNQNMIKILNATHFSFLNHDLKKGKDSTAMFVAGGGRYTLAGDQYTEYLEYCSAREWEGNTFKFTVTIEADTLTQRGIEKVENIGVERLNIEKYIRVKEL